LIDTASGEFATPSVVTPPPELPVSVTEPPELISTNLETVALMLTVPVVDCPKHVTAETISNMVKNTNLIVVKRGMICLSFEEELDVVIRPSANKLTAGATRTGKGD
jgi:hypothetical protein